MSLNQCSFIGHLGRDPEIRTFGNGGKVCNISIACTEKWKDRETGQAKEKTEWIPVAIFGDGLIRVAEQYLRKGSKVFVQGKFVTRKWQDQSGADRYSTEVVIQGAGGRLQMLDGKRDDSASQGYSAGPSAGSQPGHMPDMDDSIPFIWEGRV